MNSSNSFLTKVVPIALTLIGAVSSVAAVIFAAKEGPKYQKILDEEKEKGNEVTTPKKIVTAAKTFGPAIGFTALSLACGFGSHVLNAHTQKNLIGACALATGGFSKLKVEYKKFRDKNRELNGEEANEKIFEEMVKEDLPKELRDENGEKIYNVHLYGFDESMDGLTFKATQAEILKNILAFEVSLETLGAVSLNQFLEIFGQKPVDFGDEEGWSTDMLCGWENSCLLKFLYEVRNETELYVGPSIRAYGGYLTDYYLDY